MQVESQQIQINIHAHSSFQWRILTSAKNLI